MATSSVPRLGPERNSLTITYVSPTGVVSGWRYLWAKTVVGFDPRQHCARCLMGSYQKPVSTRMPANVALPLSLEEGTILYICGVSAPYRWANNLHLAVRVGGDGAAERATYNGGIVRVEGATPIEFDGLTAARLYPGLGPDFLTCRNFQFGAALAERGLIPLKA